MTFLQRSSASMPNPSSDSQTVSASNPPPLHDSAMDHDASPESSITSPRSRKQLGLFLAGASFFMLSILRTRRALAKRYVATRPKFYQPSNRPGQDVNGALEAVDALSLATINVFSAAMMITGGMLWAFDISSMEDMRRKVRGGMGIDGTGRSEKDAEEEMEEWLATVLARKEEKERRRREEGGEERRTNERGKER